MTQVPCPQLQDGRCRVVEQQCGLPVVPDDSACRACQSTDTPATGFANHVTTSLAMRAMRLNKPREEYVAFRNTWQKYLSTLRVVDYGWGVGTEFKRMLSGIGFRPNANSIACSIRRV